MFLRLIVVTVLLLGGTVHGESDMFITEAEAVSQAKAYTGFDFVPFASDSGMTCTLVPLDSIGLLPTVIDSAMLSPMMWRIHSAGIDITDCCSDTSDASLPLVEDVDVYLNSRSGRVVKVVMRSAEGCNCPESLWGKPRVWGDGGRSTLYGTRPPDGTLPLVRVISRMSHVDLGRLVRACEIQAYPLLYQDKLHFAGKSASPDSVAVWCVYRRYGDRGFRPVEPYITGPQIHITSMLAYDLDGEVLLPGYEQWPYYWVDPPMGRHRMDYSHCLDRLDALETAMNFTGFYRSEGYLDHNYMPEVGLAKVAVDSMVAVGLNDGKDSIDVFEVRFKNIIITPTEAWRSGTVRPRDFNVLICPESGQLVKVVSPHKSGDSLALPSPWADLLKLPPVPGTSRPVCSQDPPRIPLFEILQNSQIEELSTAQEIEAELVNFAWIKPPSPLSWPAPAARYQTIWRIHVRSFDGPGLTENGATWGTRKDEEWIIDAGTGEVRSHQWSVSPKTSNR